jgi:hypothetical protein
VPSRERSAASRGLQDHAIRLSAVAIILIALLTAARASATTDRADYAAQVNSICAGTNARVEPLVDSRARNATKRSLKILRGELGALGRVVPAPGDEALVSSWLAARRSIQDLVERDVALTRSLQRLEKKFFNGRQHPTRRLKGLFRRTGRMGHTINRIEGKVSRAADTEASLALTLDTLDCIGSIGPEDLLQG